MQQLSGALSFCDSTTGEAVRNCRSSQPASALAWLSPSTLVVTEYNQVVLWDMRLPTKGGCASRTQPSHNGMLHALSPCDNGSAVAAAGDERMVYIYDLRTW